MKRLALIAFLIGVHAPALAEVRTVILRVDNMTCGACPYIVEEALTAIPGVTAVDVSLVANTAIVTFDDQQTSVDALTTAVSDSGFPAHLVPGTN
jgi:mercuric ion binding protein